MDSIKLMGKLKLISIAALQLHNPYLYDFVLLKKTLKSHNPELKE